MPSFRCKKEQKKKLRKMLHSFIDSIKKLLEIIKLVKDILNF